MIQFAKFAEIVDEAVRTARFRERSARASSDRRI